MNILLLGKTGTRMLQVTANQGRLCINTLLLGKTNRLGRAGKSLLGIDTHRWLLYCISLLLGKNCCWLSPQYPVLLEGKVSSWRLSP